MKIIRCCRCDRRLRKIGRDWNVIVRAGVIVGHLCPGCQTPEENAEAEINAATTDYLGFNSGGRLIGRAKLVSE